MVVKGDYTLGAEHTIQYTDVTYIILLSNVTPINPIKYKMQVKD